MAAKKDAGIAGSEFDKTLKEIRATLDSMDVNAVRTDGVSLRMGDKVYALSLISENPIPESVEIREEHKQKVNKKLEEIFNVVHTKLSEMSAFTQQFREECERKELELKRKLDSAQIMPQITEDLQKAGLSVALGNERNGLTWFYRGMYWPKTVDRKPIESKFAKKLVTPIIILLQTSGDKVTHVSTRSLIGLHYFSHYHQRNPDCWGQWKHETRWKTPQDILRVAKEAEAVLENINSASLANRNPSGLPSSEILEKHVEARAGEIKTELREEIERVGATAFTTVRDTDMWST
jgi:hypothetical protein